MFHVKHSPIQELTTQRWTILDELVNIRIEVLYRQRFGQLCQSTHLASAKMSLEAMTRPTYTGDARTSSGIEPTNDPE